ncbi:MAG: cupin [Gammaproteobacteria bacterium]|nr:cupin [Gammaproteobacteria bacterium]
MPLPNQSQPVVQIVLGCSSLAASVRFLTAEAGFAVRMIMPAEDPTIAVLSTPDCVLRLEQLGAGAAPPPPARLRIVCDLDALPREAPRVLEGPDRLRVEIAALHPPLVVPEGTQEFVLTRHGAGSGWHAGRADMLYRDLIPSRLGGRFAASHILIPSCGPVPDYVHYHRVRFQMIFCRSGWVRVCYEDQGDPIVLRAGDCVLQPPQIRHRVLESSAGLEVIEVSCPAAHETWSDPDMPLPTGKNIPQREFNGQRFVHHVASEARWQASRFPGFEQRDTGIGAATHGLAGARVLRSHGGAARERRGDGAGDAHAGEFAFYFVLSGATVLESTALGAHDLNAADSCVLPAGADFAIQPTAGLELLEVTLPAELPGAATG